MPSTAGSPREHNCLGDGKKENGKRQKKKKNGRKKIYFQDICLRHSCDNNKRNREVKERKLMEKVGKWKKEYGKQHERKKTENRQKKEEYNWTCSLGGGIAYFLMSHPSITAALAIHSHICMQKRADSALH